jgi:hypothetical protein
MMVAISCASSDHVTEPDEAERESNEQDGEADVDNVHDDSPTADSGVKTLKTMAELEQFPGHQDSLMSDAESKCPRLNIR